MRTLHVAIISAFAFLLCDIDAHAQQQRLFAKSGSEIVELDTNISSLGTILRRYSVPGGSLDGGGSVGGGRYLAWVQRASSDGPAGLALFDIVEGVTRLVPIPDLANASLARVVASDRARPRVIVYSFESERTAFRFHSQIIVIDGPEFRVRRIPAGTTTRPPWAQVAYASDPGLIFMREGYTVVVFSADTGETDATYELERGIIASDQAGRLLALHMNAGGDRVYSILDGRTGREIISRALPSSITGLTVLDETRRRILIATETEFVALSFDTLNVIGRVTRPHIPRDFMRGALKYVEMQSASSSSAIFILERLLTPSSTALPSRCELAGLAAIDPNTGGLLSTALLPDPCTSQLLLVPAPDAPRDMSYSVINGRVTLSWTAPPAATHYEIEVGSAPRLRDLAVFVVGATSISGEVPSGTYYIRVRALNDAAKGPYSNELRIVVQ